MAGNEQHLKYTLYLVGLYRHDTAYSAHVSGPHAG
jgi:hypothetical protein